LTKTELVYILLYKKTHQKLQVWKYIINRLEQVCQQTLLKIFCLRMRDVVSKSSLTSYRIKT